MYSCETSICTHSPTWYPRTYVRYHYRHTQLIMKRPAASSWSLPRAALPLLLLLLHVDAFVPVSIAPRSARRAERFIIMTGHPPTTDTSSSSSSSSSSSGGASRLQHLRHAAAGIAGALGVSLLACCRISSSSSNGLVAGAAPLPGGGRGSSSLLVAAVKASGQAESQVAAKNVKVCLAGVKEMQKAAAEGDWARVRAYGDESCFLSCPTHTHGGGDGSS
jgi:hypothetical protein